jgi:Imidazolonepropionase and related amidohydrolases
MDNKKPSKIFGNFRSGLELLEQGKDADIVIWSGNPF